MNGTSIMTSNFKYARIDINASPINLGTPEFNSFFEVLTELDEVIIVVYSTYIAVFNQTCDKLWPLLPNITIAFKHYAYTIQPEGYAFTIPGWNGCGLQLAEQTDPLTMVIGY